MTSNDIRSRLAKIIFDLIPEVGAPHTAATQIMDTLEDRGLALVPIKPSQGLLMSMALRSDHGLGCPGYYDKPPFSITRDGGTGITHARRLEVALADARRMHEEVVGLGFYHPDREDRYVEMSQAALTATPKS